ncbi:FAD-dependent oxidoreductase [Nonomuraea sp. SYSU D8015]|uniref:FAD-dependent oxidoreductase n=1 Tax=Nonomuraea sp. SYSU D8015 TaxID=2593644 RepID=UPI001CB6CDF4|nr:FAD-dependent oxidoreductase [Nonomuraea sp. SYSU D8015]
MTETARKAATPPGPTGFLGGSPAALAVPHALRDGRFWQYADPPEPTGEIYDLVVVGGGLSGVSAADEWLRRDPGAHVLVLDNHDEIGGQARRAVFHRQSGRAHADTGLADAVMCDAETFGADTLVRLTGDWVARLPIAEQARADLRLLRDDPPDWLPGLPAEGKQERLAGLTYSAFLLEVCGAHPDVERFLRTVPGPEWGYDTRALGAIDAWGTGYPGFAGLGLDADKPSRFNSPTVKKQWGIADPDVYHFPEGNQGLVRTMVRRLAPGALDQPGARARFRLSSPVVSVRDGDAAATVAYFDGHQVMSVEARSVILACWSAVIPYLVPDLPHDQRQALRAAVRVPLLHATVRVRGWDAWGRTAVRELRRVRWTGAYWCLTELDVPSRPGRPAAVHLLATPCRSELGPVEGAAEGRRELIETPYDRLEHTIRDQLTRLLGPTGFDPAGDIEAITINRWGHGNAPEYCRPWHPFYPDGPFPADVARRRFGRIAIAGSDAVPAARADAAVTAAFRAVEELTR